MMNVQDFPNVDTSLQTPKKALVPTYFHLLKMIKYLQKIMKTYYYVKTVMLSKMQFLELLIPLFSPSANIHVEEISNQLKQEVLVVMT